MPTFSNPFDEALAQHGPAAVFLRDPEGAWRMESSWTRDAWGREPGPHAHGWTWLLLRDRATGFVQLVLATSPTLIPSHPRAEVRAYASLDEAEQARAAFGDPPVAGEPWTD